MASILSLPKDVLAMVFSQLWRIEAKGVPLTCKLFHQVISSQRFLSLKFKHFAITIQVTPASDHSARVANVLDQNNETFMLESDHCDTLSSLLFKVQNMDTSIGVKSLFAYAHGRMVAFRENNLVIKELEQLGPENQTVLHASSFTWQESRGSARTWCDFVNESLSSEK
jgi:hypothetical protein